MWSIGEKTRNEWLIASRICRSPSVQMIVIDHHHQRFINVACLDAQSHELLTKFTYVRLTQCPGDDRFSPFLLLSFPRSSLLLTGTFSRCSLIQGFKDTSLFLCVVLVEDSAMRNLCSLLFWFISKLFNMFISLTFVGVRTLITGDTSPSWISSVLRTGGSVFKNAGVQDLGCSENS